MRKLLLSVVVLIIISSCYGAETNKASIDSIKSYKDILGVTEEEIAAIEKLKSEREFFSVGHLLEMDALLRSDGTYAGFTNDGCRLLSELFGIEFTLVSYESWQQLRKDTDNHVLDFTDDYTPASSVRNRYYITESIADRVQQIIGFKDSDFLTEEDANGLKLGFLEGSANIEPILYRYPNLSFEAVDVDFISSIEKMLYSKEIDAFVTDRNLDAFIDNDDNIQEKEFFPLAYTSVSIVTANPELVPVISVIDKYLAEGGAKKLNQMYKESENEYKKNRLNAFFTEEERAYLDDLSQSGGKLLIALENDNYPFSFYNETEGEFQGVAVDILNEISMLIDVEFVNITTPTTSWVEILDILESKKASIVSQLGYTDEREETYTWSEPPYAVSNYALISKDSLPKVEIYQIHRLRVGVTDNTIYKEIYNKWFPDSKNLIIYPSEGETLAALETGEVDLVMGAENILQTQVNYREKTGYKINYRFTTALEAMFGFNKEDTVLSSIISKTQRQIDVESIGDYWRNKVFDYSKVIAKMQNRYLAIFTFCVLSAFSIFIILLLRTDKLKRSLEGHAATISTIYASIPDLIFSKDLNGVYTSCNASFEKYAGVKEAELIGKTDAEIFNIHDPDAIKLYKEADSRVMNNNVPEVIQETIIYPDMTKRILETLKAPLLKNGKPVGLLGIGRDVTERKEAKSRLERIINTAQIAFILTVDGIVVEANEYSQRNIGVKIGDEMQRFYTEPEQRDVIIKTIEENGAASNIIVKYNMANGESHRFLASFSCADYDNRESYLFWALDVEQDKEREERLFAAQQSFQSVLDALPMPVRVVDLETGIIIYVNDSLVELLEYETVDEICGCGLNIADIISDTLSDGTISSERLELIMKAVEPISVEMNYVTKTGRIIEAMIVSRQIEYMGRRASIGIIKDLTAEKERERILMEAAERERDANQTKTMFLANMSHEIRTPMNGVIGMTDLLLSEQLSGRQLQYVKDIKISAELLLGIINDILDLSKITEGQLEIVQVDTDLSMLLKNTVSMMSFSANSKGLTFIDDIQINTPEYVRIDDIRLKQVIVNLLSNAIKFTKKGHVKLSVKIENENISVAVSDTGIGIAKDELPLIFMAFEQADRRKNRAIKGTGLGLTISKNLVELMGGNLWVESEYGKGTTFHFTVQYVAGDEVNAETTDMVFDYISAPTAQVLLVDDIQTNLTVGAGLLRHCNIPADVAISGREAIELIEAKDYDVVFMDHMMPDMDGIETTKLIRSLGEKYRTLPVIALTANAVNESRDFLLSSGMDDFLSKPIDRQELMKILIKWLPSNKIEQGTRPDEGMQNDKYSEILEAASKIDGLDISLALSRIGGMQGVLEKSLKQAANSIPERIKNMDASLTAESLRSFGIDAHGLKGALANIGAMRNSDLAAGLEIAAKAENLPQCLEKFTIFSDAMERFVSDLKAILPQQEKQTKPTGDMRLVKSKADEAMELLGKFEANNALECLNELISYTYGEETDELLSEAISLINAFKYKDARLIMQKLCAE